MPNPHFCLASECRQHFRNSDTVSPRLASEVKLSESLHKHNSAHARTKLYQLLSMIWCAKSVSCQRRLLLAKLSPITWDHNICPEAAQAIHLQTVQFSYRNSLTYTFSDSSTKTRNDRNRRHFPTIVSTKSDPDRGYSSR